MDLYHSEIRLPTGFRAPTARVSLAWTRHADFARTSDRYNTIRRIQSVTLSRLQVIEVGVEGGKVVKILFRGRYDENHDLSIVLIPNGHRPWTVKTVWLNEHTDTHNTLDRSKYVK